MKPFITGTQAFGAISEGSDIDIVMHVGDVPDFEKYLTSLGICQHRTEAMKTNSYPGFYFDFFGMKFNVIACNGKEMLAWKRATEVMRAKHPNIKDREKRIDFFKAYKSMAFDGQLP